MDTPRCRNREVNPSKEKTRRKKSSEIMDPSIAEIMNIPEVFAAELAKDSSSSPKAKQV